MLHEAELHLQQGYITIVGENNGIKATLRIWADVFDPVAHIDIEANKKISVEAAYESWRYQDRVIKSRENFGNSWKWVAPKNTVYKKDSIHFTGDEVLFYHHNAAETIFDATVTQQEMDAVKDQLYNPLKNLVAGGSVGGKNFSPAGTYAGVYGNTDYKGWKLKSISSAKQHSLHLYLHTAQAPNIEQWEQGLGSLKRATPANKIAFDKSQQWWKQFWERSFIRMKAMQIPKHGRWAATFNCFVTCSRAMHTVHGQRNLTAVFLLLILCIQIPLTN